jgi:hypothetical protein
MSDEDSEIDERLGPLLEHFADRLNRVFAYCFCVFEFRDDGDLRDDPGMNSRAWTLRTIKNACLHETLAAIRDVDDFLTPRRPATRDDDLRASDFGYQKSGSFLSKSEREAIHKLVVHTTTTGAAADGFRWDVWELTTKCVLQATEFLTWVEKTHLGFRLWTAALYCRDRSQKIHAWAAKEVAAHPERPSS